MKNIKIGILTWHYYTNFGSALQCYALYRHLKTKGLNVEVINYRKIKDIGPAGNLFRGILHYSLGKINTRYAYTYISFLHKYLKLSKPLYEFDKDIVDYDAIICGSDQIWAPNVFNPVYMLNFCDSAKMKKISYAASVGLNSIPEDLIPKYKELLSDFDHISVREESGAKLLEEKCGIKNIRTVLDPTLLLDKEEYIKLERKVKVPVKFVFCYFLNANNEYEQRVKNYAEKHGLSIVGWSAKENDKAYLGDYKWIGPCEFLWLIHNASCVFTDSYHGTIFSMLYHEPFYTFERFSSDDPINQNSRIYQLDKWFGISERIVTDTHPIDACKNFDYETFEGNLKKARKISIDFLEEALADA